MADKQLGTPVDPAGNYGLGQAEADRARAWAAEKAKEINADPSIPRRHRADADREAERLVDRPMRSVTLPPSVTPGNAPGETTAERKKRLTRERVKAHRAAKRKT